jgi:2-dehydro-3-deoxyphosphogluconate aldolase/(4S)-4-hydroxy-2-oxoglutarate aldolase
MTMGLRDGMRVTVDELIALSPVIPVVVVDQVTDAVPVARALVAGGLRVIEITLRTRAAEEAIHRIAVEVEDAVVGAGTVVGAEQVDAALAAGATFLVSPGTTPTLLDALQASGAPFLPGACTPSEVVSLLEREVTLAKLFPAQAIGGIGWLRALASPFPSMRFCPTGGIDEHLAAEYLALGNVACVGGSWMLPAQAIRAGDWATIEALARAAARLRSSDS